MTGPADRDVRAAWDANAAFWDRRMAEPDSWQQTLIYPTVERLLAVRAGERVLDVACGNGLFAQHLGEAGALVLASDFSEEQLRFARGRVTSDAVELRLLDVTNEAALRALGEARFDAVVANMALMDVSDTGPLASALPHVLVAGGRFVFSVLHPAFNNLSSTLVSETRGEGTAFVTEHAVKVSRYALGQVGQGVGIPGQPVAHWYFDRSLSDLLRPFLAAGLVLDALEEPAFDPADAEEHDEHAIWTQVPPILAARLCLPVAAAREP